MISNATYRAARTVAASIENYFNEHHELASRRGDASLAPSPSAGVVEAMIDTAFWASLRREEGYSPKISLAYFPPEMAKRPLIFEKYLPLNADVLIKLSPGVERAGIHLGVWQQDDALYVWGTTMQIPDLCFVLDVPEPGLLVVKHRRPYGFGKFSNVAVLIGDKIKMIDESRTDIPALPPMLSSFLDASSGNDEPVNLLVQMAVSMRRHGHGGTLLIVPSHTNHWTKSLMKPMSYMVTPPFSGLADLALPDKQQADPEIRRALLRQEVDNIAGLTAIDGATIINNRYELLAFGAKILQQREGAAVEEVFVTEPVSAEVPGLIHISQIGGTRHISAVQFVHDQRDTLALVASQDGRFTIFCWSDRLEMVQAYRIDSLLL